MRTIKIKNQVSNTSWQDIYVLIAIFLVHAIIDITIIVICLNTGMNLSEFVAYVFNNFVQGEFELKLIILDLIFAPIFLFVAIANGIYKRYLDDKFANLDKNAINDFIFYKEGVSVRYKNADVPQRNIMYKNIKQMRYTISAIDTSRGPYINNSYVTLVDIDDNIYKLRFFPVNMKKLYKIACYAKYMQSFEYAINGGGKKLRKCLEKNFKKIIANGYKIPIALLLPKIFLYILFGIFILSIGFILYMQIPAHTNDIEKEYASYVDNGYSYYQNGRYDDALREYDKALNINKEDHVLYYYRALAYQYRGQYNKAIDEANKGIEYINLKSTYHYAKNIKLIKDDIGLYDTLADCYMQIKQYNKALDSINYVIEHVSYKYTDAYFKRGMCKFYLDDKAGALTDFYKHREIINTYLEDQNSTEYKALYPMYTNKNLENVNLWINACRN